MAVVSLRKAEELTGLTRSALLKSIKNGRLTASRADNGEWRVDTSELARVFEVTPEEAVKPVPRVGEGSEVEVVQLRERVLGLENLVLSLNDTVGDLRTRLTKESEERSRITLMLTHQMGQKSESAGPERSQTSNKWLTPILVVLSVALTLAGVWLFELNKAVG